MMARRRASGVTAASSNAVSSTAGKSATNGKSANAGAAVRALRGEEVLVWASGCEHRSSDAAGNAPARKRLLRRGPAPGVPALLVATRARRGGALRMHLLAEVGQSARSWPLADLRLVDGLGLPVREATDFALTFTGAGRPLVWRCESPPKRAAFLWTLLQVCAAGLQSRAPPSQGLSLFELQTFALEVAAKPPPSSSSSGKQTSVEKVDVKAGARGGVDGTSSDRDTAPLVPKTDSSRRVVRTASEPQAGALHRLAQRAEKRDERRSADGAAVAFGRDLTIHERAFLIAATRLGAEPADFAIRSRPQSPLPTAAPDTTVSDAPRSGTIAASKSPKPAPVPRRPSGSSLRKPIDVREGASATAMLVARCKLQEERRLFRLDKGEAADLAHALHLFDDSASGNDTSSKDLCSFAAWTRERMQHIEATNMADTVQIELHPQHSEVASFRRALVESVGGASPWLAAAEARLAPYASLIEDIQTRAELLDRHRAHAVKLRDRLHQLLEEEKIGLTSTA